MASSDFLVEYLAGSAFQLAVSRVSNHLSNTPFRVCYGKHRYPGFPLNHAARFDRLYAPDPKNRTPGDEFGASPGYLPGHDAVRADLVQAEQFGTGVRFVRDRSARVLPIEEVQARCVLDQQPLAQPIAQGSRVGSISSLTARPSPVCAPTALLPRRGYKTRRRSALRPRARRIVAWRRCPGRRQASRSSGPALYSAPSRCCRTSSSVLMKRTLLFESSARWRNHQSESITRSSGASTPGSCISDA